MASLFVHLQLIGILISFIFLVILFFKKSDKEQKFMITSFLCTLIYCCGMYLEYTSPSLEIAIVAVKIQYFSACYLPIFIVIFSFHHCRVKLPKAVIGVLTIMETIVLLFVWNCEYTEGFYKDLSLGKKGDFSFIIVEHGPVWFVYVGAYAIILSLVVGVTFYRIKKKPQGFRMKYYIICISCSLPAIAYGLYKANLTNDYDLTSLVYLIVCLLLYFAIYRLQFFGLIDLARENVVDNMKEALIIVDINYNLLDSNNAAKKLFPEIKKMKNQENISSIEPLMNLFSDNTSQEFELYGKYYKKNITVLEDSKLSVKGFCAIVIDVTQTHEYVGELIEANEKAKAAGEAKSRYLANVSHEIRTPMNAIVGFSELILHQNPTDQIYEYAKDINDAALSLLAVINDILDLSKIEAGKLELNNGEYTTTELLNNVISIIKLQAANKNLTFNIDINPNLPSKLLGDIVHLRQILINILANAVKYTKKGSISLQVTFAASATLSDTIDFVIRIKDTGIGISSENIPSLFDEFSRIENKREVTEGSGLGLSICKNLVEMMNGSIAVESILGEGSTFTVIVPQTVISMEAISPQILAALNSTPYEQTISSTSLASDTVVNAFWAPMASILVVDDSKVNLKLVTSILEEYQIKADITTSGRAALDMVGKKKYHLVFMDHMMPEFDGIMATKAIRENGHTSLPIIALTANAVIGMKEMFLSNGFTDFISKPVNISELEKLLIKYLPAELINYYEKENIDEKLSINELQSEGLNIPGKSINILDGYNRCMKNKDTYISILDTFYRTSKSIKDEALTYIAQKNYEKLLLFTHTMKNSAFTIGANKLSTLAKEAENILKNKNHPLFDSKAGKLMDAFDDVINDLTEFYDERNISSDTSLIKPRIEQVKFLSKLKSLKQQLEMMDSVQANDTITYLTAHSYSDKIVTATLQSCKNDIADFEYDRAIEKLERIYERING